MTASAIMRHQFELIKVGDDYSYLVELAGKPLGVLYLPNLAIVVYGEAGGTGRFFFVFSQGQLVEKGAI